MNIWISYSLTDKSFVDRLKNSLATRGHNILVVDQSLSAGESILRTIENYIRKSDVFLVVLSKESEKSRWFTSELLIILNEASKANKNKKVIPIAINKGVRLPPVIDQIAFADFSNPDNYEQNLERLITSIERPIIQDIPDTETKIDFLIKEKQKLLDLEKKEYLLQNSKKQEVKNLFRFTTIVTMFAAVISTIYIFYGEFSKSNNLFNDKDFTSKIIFYFLGVLTAIIPTIYFILKSKQDK